VKWSVSAGTLSATTGTPVTFTAPTVSSLTNVTITATSVQDPSKFGTTTIKVEPLGIQEVVVALSAFNTALAQHASLEITATVTGSANTAVTWSVFPSSGLSLNKNGNTVNVNGDALGSYSLKATSLEDSTKSAQAIVTVSSSGTTLNAMVVAGGNHSLALKANGTVMAWGLNDQGQLGSSGANSATPMQVSGLNQVIQIAAGASHNLALKSDGTVWAWGANGFGQLGNGTTTGSSLPVQVSNLNNVVMIASSSDSSFSVAAKSDHTVWAWGKNNNGELGDNTTISRSVPVQTYHMDIVCPGGTPCTVTGLTFIAAGTQHLLGYDGTTFFACGDNSGGAFGNGSTISKTVATPVQTLEANIPQINSRIQLAAGHQYSMALKADGTVLTWGLEAYGILGHFPIVDPTKPSLIPEFGNVSQISAGYAHALAVKNDGTVWAWGNGDQGQTGSAFNITNMPAQVALLSNIVQVAAGRSHSLVVKSDGTVWAFGYDLYGQLGRGFTPSSYSRTPVQVTTVLLF
jgi:alpha-tubulin suppressor-like RCC1 family protein